MKTIDIYNETGAGTVRYTHYLSDGEMIYKVITGGDACYAIVEDCICDNFEVNRRKLKEIRQDIKKHQQIYCMVEYGHRLPAGSFITFR